MSPTPDDADIVEPGATRGALLDLTPEQLSDRANGLVKEYIGSRDDGELLLSAAELGCVEDANDDEASAKICEAAIDIVLNSRDATAWAVRHLNFSSLR